MYQPVIGITLSKKKSFFDSDYVKAVQRAGGIPKLIPNDTSEDMLAKIRETCDGVLISGGGDINPSLFGEEPHLKTGFIDDDRDRLEFLLVKMAKDTEWPILGICRGHQMLNIALKGTLFQDVPSQFSKSIHHQLNDVYPAHNVQIEKNTGLSQILTLETVQVNSRHHQAVKDLAPGLRVTARSSDGLIEGIEFPGHRFFNGVQWHPEDLQEYEEHRRVFTSFIAAAGR